MRITGLEHSNFKVGDQKREGEGKADEGSCQEITASFTRAGPSLTALKRNDLKRVWGGREKRGLKAPRKKTTVGYTGKHSRDDGEWRDVRDSDRTE